MVKTIITTLAVSLLLFFGVILESNYIKTEFNELHANFSTLYEKVEEESANKQDVLAVQQNWLKKKSRLHIFIPHNEIKEIDMWLAESATLVRDKEWQDAISKIEVLKELTEQIPNTFRLSIENIL